MRFSVPANAMFYLQVNLKITEKSCIKQIITVVADSPYISFHTEVRACVVFFCLFVSCVVLHTVLIGPLPCS